MGYVNGYYDGYEDGVRDSRKKASPPVCRSGIVRTDDGFLMIPVGRFWVGGAQVDGYRKVSFDGDAASFRIVDQDGTDRTVYVKSGSSFVKTAAGFPPVGPDDPTLATVDMASGSPVISVETDDDGPLDLYYEDASGNRLPGYSLIGTTN